MRVSMAARLILASSLLVSPALATTAVEMSTAEMAQGSDLVVLGRATGQAVRWVGRVLVTDVTVQLTEVLKGDVAAGQTLVVSLPGGIDSNRRFPVAMTYPAAPSIGDGEEVFLFLVADEEFGHTVAGFSQGKFSVIRAGEQAWVSRDLTELRLATGTGTVRGGPHTRQELDGLKNDVLTALGR